MIPWKLLEAAGVSEPVAAAVALALLGVAALVALAARRTAFARRSYFMPVFREAFEVSAFLRAFAAYAGALVALALVGGLLWLRASP